MTTMAAAQAAAPGRLNVLDNAVLVAFRQGAFGIRRAVGTEIVATDADKTMLHLTKALLDSSEYRAVINNRRDFVERVLDRRAVPSALGGTATRVLPLRFVPDIEREYEAFKIRDERLVETFVAAYPRLVERAQGRLKSEFNPKDYPSAWEVGERFYTTLSYLALSAPESLKTVSGALYARETAAFYASLSKTAEKIDTFLGESLAELVDWMVDRLSDRKDGRAKVFDTRFSEKLDMIRDFLATYKDRNLTGSTRLDTLVARATALMRGVDADAVKRQDYRKAVRAGFEQIKGVLDSLVVTKPTRRIILED